jgi:ABC-2 family transporter protein
MTTTTTTTYQSTQPAGRDGFPQLLRAEWTKFRTVRGWVIAIVAAALVIALATVYLASGAQNHNTSPNVATGPGGEAVTDTFYFVRQPLDGNGSITVRVTSLTGTGQPTPRPDGFTGPPLTEPWAKAGIIMKQSTAPGSPYAAIMATPGHGVRMQDNFTHDTAGPAGAVAAASPRWLRLTRSGDTLTGYASANGISWTMVGRARLGGLPSTVQAGLFVASPQDLQATQTFGGNNNGGGGPTQATAIFDHVSLQGQFPGHAWRGGQIGAGELTPFGPVHHCIGQTCQKSVEKEPDGFKASGGTFTVAGSGDIAPYQPIVDPLQVTFYGALFGLITVIALGTLFITAEYRRGMIRTTLAASPRRGRVLAAKAIVIGSVAFAAGLAGAAVAFPIAEHKLQAEGWAPPVYLPISLLSGTGLRVVVGTAALTAVTAILALAAGTVLRRSAGAITAVIGLVIFPLVLAIILPLAPADWLLRLTPAAAFGLQQAIPRYSQVSTSCLPYNGCYPLAPWTGFAVLCLWAAAALAVAVFLLRRRDA